jgi:hypothetical protein
MADKAPSKRKAVHLRADDEILEELGKASANLLYLSESDYSFELIRWNGGSEITPEFLYNITGEPHDHPVNEIALEAFMSGPYESLALLLKANLSNLKVFKVGRINMPVYIVGRSPEGNWLGLSTRVVET